MTYEGETSIFERFNGRNNAPVDVGVRELGAKEAVHLLVVAGDVEETPAHFDGLEV